MHPSERSLLAIFGRCWPQQVANVQILLPRVSANAARRLVDAMLAIAGCETRISDVPPSRYGDANETGSSCALIETGIGSFSTAVVSSSIIALARLST